MTKSKLIIGVAALMLAIITKAECTDPNDPACQGGTNTPPPVPSAVYTNMHLAVSAGETTVSVLLTNGSLLEDYVIETSPDLITWTAATDKFETDTNGVAAFLFQKSNAQEFFRARVATYVAYATGGAAAGSFDCGSYVGYANYYGFDGAWGYLLNTNMSRHFVYDGSGRTNSIMTYLGRFGDHGCGTFSCEVIEIGSKRYRMSAMFKSPLPTGPYAVRMKGLDEDPADMFRVFNWMVFDGPGPNAQGFFF